MTKLKSFFKELFEGWFHLSIFSAVTDLFVMIFLTIMGKKRDK